MTNLYDYFHGHEGKEKSFYQKQMEQFREANAEASEKLTEAKYKHLLNKYVEVLNELDILKSKLAAIEAERKLKNEIE